MRILLRNLLPNDALTIDVPVDERRVLRGKIPPGGTLDAGRDFTLDELNRAATLRALVSAGRISISTESEPSDIEGLMDSQMLQFNQQVAATVAEAAGFIGTADMAGTLQVEAQVGAIPGVGEIMVVDVFKNGVSVLTAPITINATTSPSARTVLFGIEKTGAAGAVVKGDQLSCSLTYTAGAPTPIVRTSVRVKILKG